jgi:hypothetical protein
MLMESAAHQLQALLPKLWNTRTHWDIFKGGATSLTEWHAVSDNLFEVKSYANHFCLYNSFSIDLILKSHPMNPSDFVEPIDVFTNRICTTWTTAPFIAVQRGSLSDIEMKFVDYTFLFETAENQLLQMKVSPRSNASHIIMIIMAVVVIALYFLRSLFASLG